MGGLAAASTSSRCAHAFSPHTPSAPPSPRARPPPPTSHPPVHPTRSCGPEKGGILEELVASQQPALALELGTFMG